MAFLTPSSCSTASPSLPSPLPTKSSIPSPSSGSCFYRRFSSSPSSDFSLTTQVLEDSSHGQHLRLHVVSTSLSWTAQKSCLKLAASTFYMERFSGDEALHSLIKGPATRRRRRLTGVPASSITVPAELVTPLHNNVAHMPRRIAIFVEPSPFARKMATMMELGSEDDPRASTFSLTDEDHTLGNALRYVLNHDPRVEFCGYSVPHPSENRVNIRIQTTGAPAKDVLKDALQDLMLMCQHVRTTFDNAVDQHRVSEKMKEVSMKSSLINPTSSKSESMQYKAVKP